MKKKKFDNYKAKDIISEATKKYRGIEILKWKLSNKSLKLKRCSFTDPVTSQE